MSQRDTETLGRSIGIVFGTLLGAGILSSGVDLLLAAYWPSAFDSNGRTHAVGILLLMLVSSSVVGTVASFVAARLASNQPMRHALAVGGLRAAIIILLLPFLHAAGLDLATPWYHVVDLVLAFPCAWVGGYLATRHGSDRILSGTSAA
jgi:hypothetical protein